MLLKSYFLCSNKMVMSISTLYDHNILEINCKKFYFLLFLYLLQQLFYLHKFYVMTNKKQSEESKKVHFYKKSNSVTTNSVFKTS